MSSVFVLRARTKHFKVIGIFSTPECAYSGVLDFLGVEDKLGESYSFSVSSDFACRALEVARELKKTEDSGKHNISRLMAADPRMVVIFHSLSNDYERVKMERVPLNELLLDDEEGDL